MNLILFEYSGYIVSEKQNVLHENSQKMLNFGKPKARIGLVLKEKGRLSSACFFEKSLAWLSSPYQKTRLSLLKSRLGPNTSI